MSSYAGFQEKLKRRLEVVVPKSEDIAESRKVAATLIEKLTSYFKGYPRDNPAGVNQLELVGGVPEGAMTSKTPTFDVLMMIRPTQQCRLSDPEPPMGVVVPTVFVRRASMETSSWREFTKPVPPGNKHQIIAEKVTPHLFQLLDKAIEYQSNINDGTFTKVTFRWGKIANDDPISPARKLLEVIDRPTGSVMMTVCFASCLEVDEDGVKSYALASVDNQWRMTFAFRERDLLSTADKTDSGCRLGCYTLTKALLKCQYPALAKNGRTHQIAKALLIKEMHETANAATKWKFDMFGDRFFAMLGNLSSSLQAGKLDHGYAKFMGGKANLLEGVTGLAEIRSDLEERLKNPDTKLLPSIKAVN